MKKIISILFFYHFSVFAFAEISVITQVGDTLSSGDVIKTLSPVSSAAVGEQGHSVLGAAVDRIEGAQDVLAPIGAGLEQRNEVGRRFRRRDG